MTDDIESLSRKLDRALEILERLAIGTPKQQERAQWVKAYIGQHHYICYSIVKDVPAFIRLFTHNTTFHRSMGKMLDVFGWKVKEVEDTYYYEDGFDIDAITQKRKWRNYRPDDQAFLQYLVKEVIFPQKKVNLHDWLQEAYPQRSKKWINDVEDNLTIFIKAHGYKIRKTNDWFEVFV